MVNMIYLFVVFFALFFALSLFRFRLAVSFFIFLLPTYLIRASFGQLLPTTLLEMTFGAIALAWSIKYARTDWKNISHQIRSHKIFFIFYFLFLISSVVSIFVSDMWYRSLGEWRAFFLEPMILFVILLGRTSSPHLNKRETLSPSDIILSLIFSTLSISIFGLLQSLTGWHIGTVDLAAIQTGRVTSFFTSPNAVGLYLGPILILMIGVLASRVKRAEAISPSSNNPTIREIATSPSFLGLLAMTIVALATLLLTKSIGAWAGVATGLLLFIFLIGRKKIITISITFAILLSAFCFLFFTDTKSQSITNRLVLWNYSWQFLSQSPKNFFLGAGVRQFYRKIQKPHYNKEELERLTYPHNIFLNFWTETGLLGMVAFTALYSFLLIFSYKFYRHSDKILGACFVATLITFLIHGLIDVPYFKNDLAMMFWIISAIIISHRNHTVIPTTGGNTGSTNTDTVRR